MSSSTVRDPWMLLLLAASVAWLPNLLSAQTCAEVASTTVQMYDCAAVRAQSTDSLLVQVEAAIRDRLADEPLIAFQNARELWASYRFEHCRFAASSAGGGSLGSIIYLSCLATLAAQRVEILAELVCEGGGLTGTCTATDAYRAALLRTMRE